MKVTQQPHRHEGAVQDRKPALVSRRQIGKSIAGAAALTLAAGSMRPRPAAAQEYRWRAAHYFKDDNPWNKGLIYFDKLLGERTGGKIKIDIYNNGVLGSENQTLQFVKDGSLDITIADPNAGVSFCKELDFFSMPFMFLSYEQWQASLDGAPGQAFTKIVQEKTGIRILGYWGGSVRNLLSTKKPITSMAELKGFRIRVQPSPLLIDAWKAIGCVPTPVAFLETYLAMKSGVVDGMENESVMVDDMKLYEPAPFIARTQHQITARPLFMAGKTFDALPPELQKIVIQAAKEATVYEREQEQAAGKAAEDDMEKKGVKFNAIDKAPFQAATKPVIDAYAKSIDMTAMLAAFQAAK
jgi:tripartite ATP-independent transporter DctP family solute receptor